MLVSCPSVLSGFWLSEFQKSTWFRKFENFQSQLKILAQYRKHRNETNYAFLARMTLSQLPTSAERSYVYLNEYVTRHCVTFS